MTMWKWTPKICHIQTHSDEGITIEEEKRELIQFLKKELFFLALQPDGDIERYILLEDTGFKATVIE